MRLVMKKLTERMELSEPRSAASSCETEPRIAARSGTVPAGSRPAIT